MNAELLIQELGSALGIHDLQLDDQHACTLVYEGDLITIQYQPQDVTFLLFAAVADGEKILSLELCTYLLQANLFGQATLGMHLGYFAPASAVVLSASKDADNLTAAEFVDFLSFFAVELEKWKQQIRPFLEGETPTEPEFDTTLTMSSLSMQGFLRA